jgi:hypothetical protein
LGRDQRQLVAILVGDVVRHSMARADAVIE